MKTRIIVLILLFANFSCRTNKTTSDNNKDRIKGEVKAVVDIIFKGSEEANFELITEQWLNSPDFIILINGRTFNYEKAMAMKPAFNKILNEKGTVLQEKYSVIDNSTVLYTANCKWIVNYKDGHSILEDPEAFLFIFKKIDNRWRVIYYADSYCERDVTDEGSKVLDQFELP